MSKVCVSHNSPTRTAKYPLQFTRKYPTICWCWDDGKGHMLRSELSKGELEFLHDVTASVTCQTCRPGSRCLSASQQKQPRRHAYAHATHTSTHARASARMLCQMIRLIHMTGGSGVKWLKACLWRLTLLTAWAVVQHLSSSFFSPKGPRAKNAVVWLLDPAAVESNDQVEWLQILF